MEASGYDCNFLSEPADALNCLICLSVARDPRQHEECGKLFCNDCIEKYGTDKPCPNCIKTGAFYKDRRGKRDISELQVKCDNAKRKCEWVGTVGTLQEHVDTCKFTLLPCPKQCNKDKLFMRRGLSIHLAHFCPKRYHTCEHCGEEGTYASIQKHDKTCGKKEVNCPTAGCEKIMQRCNVEKHVKAKCEHAIISCKYISLGCDSELKRKGMAAHEEDKDLHLGMALETITLLREERKNGEPLKFKFTDYQKRKDCGKIVHSPSYYTSPYGYLIALRVDANGNGAGQGTHVSVFARILKGRHDGELKWPLVGKVTFTLFNQLEDKNHRLGTIYLTTETDVQAGGARGIAKFVLNSELGYNEDKNTQYLLDDTLYFSLAVEVANHKPWLE